MEDKPNIKFGLLPETSAAIQKSLESYHDSLAGLKQMVEEFRKRPLIDFPPNFKGIANLVIFGTDSLREFLELNPDHFRKLDEKHNEVEVKTKETFRVLKTEFISYLEKNGYIIPDEKNFFHWYFFVKYGDAPFTISALEKMATVTPNHFKEYHDYKVSQFHQEEKTIEIGKSRTNKVLPELIEAIKEPGKLLKVWERLAVMENPFVNEHGKFLGHEKSKKHREVMGLAQSICIWFEAGQFEVYSMLCIKFGLKEAPRSERIPKKAGYDEIRLSILSEIKDLLK